MFKHYMFFRRKNLENRKMNSEVGVSVVFSVCNHHRRVVTIPVTETSVDLGSYALPLAHLSDPTSAGSETRDFVLIDYYIMCCFVSSGKVRRYTYVSTPLV